jgi:hypothetical protein
MQALHLLPKRFEFADAVLLGNYPLNGNRFACSVAVLFQLLAYLRGEYWIASWAQIASVAELAPRLDRHALDAAALDRLDTLISMVATFRGNPVLVRLWAPKYTKAGLSRSHGRASLALLNDRPHYDFHWRVPDVRLLRIVYKEIARALDTCALSWESGCNDISMSLQPLGLQQAPAVWQAAVAELTGKLDLVGCPYVVEIK